VDKLDKIILYKKWISRGCANPITNQAPQRSKKWAKKGTNDVLFPHPHNQSHKIGNHDQ
jgi:hypothetical protein